MLTIDFLSSLSLSSHLRDKTPQTTFRVVTLFLVF